jgi:hypothetical protein
MNRGGRIVADLRALLGLFSEKCEDRTTLDEMSHLLISIDRGRWAKAKGVFDSIRQKTRAAEKEGLQTKIAQYAFEEVCAKTVYNLSGALAPFDPDSPYWIVPSAVVLARTLGVDELDVLRVVAV